MPVPEPSPLTSSYHRTGLQVYKPAITRIDLTVVTVDTCRESLNAETPNPSLRRLCVKYSESRTEVLFTVFGHGCELKWVVLNACV